MTFPRLVAWRRTDVPGGLGLGHVEEHDDDVVLTGREIVTEADLRYAVGFRLVVGPDWESEKVEAEVIDPTGIRRLELTRAEDGTWLLGDDLIADGMECDDVDVASTPLTNTPPIVRLALAVGEAAEIPILWVRIPELAVELVRQRYERLEPAGGLARYRFSFVGVSPEYLLTVDDDGLVVDYDGFATRL